MVIGPPEEEIRADRTPRSRRPRGPSPRVSPPTRWRSSRSARRARVRQPGPRPLTTCGSSTDRTTPPRLCSRARTSQGRARPSTGSTALEPGDYFFYCELHPGTAMTGTVTASEGAGAVEVVAQNTAFDTDEIHLPADTPSKLALDNEDAFAHNLSIYEDDTASGEPLVHVRAVLRAGDEDVRRAGPRGRGVLLPLRHPPDDGGHGRGGAGAASRRRRARGTSPGSRAGTTRAARPAGSVVRVPLPARRLSFVASLLFIVTADRVRVGRGLDLRRRRDGSAAASARRARRSTATQLDAAAHADGGVLVINVWATGARRAAPSSRSWSDLASRYADDGVRFLGINYHDDRTPRRAGSGSSTCRTRACSTPPAGPRPTSGSRPCPTPTSWTRAGTIRWVVFGETDGAQLAGLIDDVLA